MYVPNKYLVIFIYICGLFSNSIDALINYISLQVLEYNFPNVAYNANNVFIKIFYDNYSRNFYKKKNSEISKIRRKMRDAVKGHF